MTAGDSGPGSSQLVDVVIMTNDDGEACWITADPATVDRSDPAELVGQIPAGQPAELQRLDAAMLKIAAAAVATTNRSVNGEWLTPCPPLQARWLPPVAERAAAPVDGDDRYHLWYAHSEAGQ